MNIGSFTDSITEHRPQREMSSESHSGLTAFADYCPVEIYRVEYYPSILCKYEVKQAHWLSCN